MEVLFGIPMFRIMVVLLAIFIGIMVVVVFMAWRNRVMLKLGLRNIPRRRAQSVLIVMGSMLSAVIIASAFGIGDTISFSIRDNATKDLGTIDEVLRSTSDPENFGQRSAPYFPKDRFDGPFRRTDTRVLRLRRHRSDGALYRGDGPRP